MKPAILGCIIEHFTMNKPIISEQSASTGHTIDENDSDVVKKIKELLDSKVRPAVAMDGGDIIYDSFKDGVVYLHMQGACSGCPSSTATLKMGIENMLKHLEKGKIVCATRIEPPIHPAGFEKHVQNFGVEHNEFDWTAFEMFCNNTLITEKDKTTTGIFAPWMLYKEDHLSIGGHDQRFSPYGYEDSDIFNRWIQAGYEMVQARDSLCYHMTCRGHRWNAGVGIENSDYRETMDRCRREFIRKWGDWIQNDKYQMPIIWTKYDRGIIIKNSNPQLIEMLEPWGDNLYVDCSYEEYIEKESKRTVTDLHDRIKPYDNEKQNPILVEIDGSNFNQQDMIYIQKIAEILDTQKPESGTFQLGNLLLTIIQNKHD